MIKINIYELAAIAQLKNFKKQIKKKNKEDKENNKLSKHEESIFKYGVMIGMEVQENVNKQCDFIEENPISQKQRIQEEFERRLQNSSLTQESQKVAIELLKEVQNE